jgi:hypothetical protein
MLGRTKSNGRCDSPLERGGVVCSVRVASIELVKMHGGETHPRHYTPLRTPSQEGSRKNAGHNLRIHYHVQNRPV